MDRDYMRGRSEARQKPFSPPEPTVGSFLWPLLLWVCVFYLMFKAFSWYEQSRTGQTPRLTGSTPTVANPVEPAPVRPAVPQSQRRSEPPHTREGSVISKCVRNGDASLTDTGCEPGSKQQAIARVPPPNYAAPVQAARPETSGTSQIYLCKAYDGGAFWSNTHCGQQRAHIERIASVPPGMPFDQQVDIANQQRRFAQEIAAASIAQPMQQASPAAALKLQCAALEEQIRAIDARARQPLTAGEQDYLAQKRKEARDIQFRMRCQ